MGQVAYHPPGLQGAAECVMTPKDPENLHIKRNVKLTWKEEYVNGNSNNNNNNNNSSINNKGIYSFFKGIFRRPTAEDVLTKTLEHRSPFHGRFDDDGDDDGDDDDEEEDGMNEIHGFPRKRRKIRCRYCHIDVTHRESIKCPKCQCKSETYCSWRCHKLRRRKHRWKCAHIVQFKKMEKYMMIMKPGETFGCLEDIWGLEHEFVGGSKYSILLRIERVASRDDSIFHCRDREGRKIKLKMKCEDPYFIRWSTTMHPYNLYVSVPNAFLQPLHPGSWSEHKEDIGIIYNTAVLFYQYGDENIDGTTKFRTIEPRRNKALKVWIHDLKL